MQLLETVSGTPFFGSASAPTATIVSLRLPAARQFGANLSPPMAGGLLLGAPPLAEVWWAACSIVSLHVPMVLASLVAWHLGCFPCDLMGVCGTGRPMARNATLALLATSAAASPGMGRTCFNRSFRIFLKCCLGMGSRTPSKDCFGKAIPINQASQTSLSYCRLGPTSCISQNKFSE